MAQCYWCSFTLDYQMDKCPECGAAVDASAVLHEARSLIKASLLVGCILTLLMPFPDWLILVEYFRGRGYIDQNVLTVLILLLGGSIASTIMLGTAWNKVRKGQRPSLKRATVLALAVAAARVLMYVWFGLMT